uniref:RAB24, member RAS oncogene family n=1 Tax=Fundulus heteroclitus TaxID=8078 RepID=A0A3Q2PYX5_FUNHE
MSAMRVDAKVVMLGKESVGKTSLVERYVHHRFLVGPYQNTIGAAFVAKPIQVGDKVITLGIWDTAGSERYEAMSRIYYRGARAAVVCYGKSTLGKYNKNTIKSKRCYRQVKCKSESIGAQYFETSSKTGKNVGKFYWQLVVSAVPSEAFVSLEETGVDLDQKKDSYFYTCCHNN